MRRTGPSPTVAADGRRGDRKRARSARRGNDIDPADERRAEVVVVLDALDADIGETARREGRVDPNDAVDVIGLPRGARLRWSSDGPGAIDQYAHRPPD